MKGTSDRIEARSRKLAGAIHSVVPHDVTTVAICCCDKHGEDRAVAVAAAVRLGARAVLIPGDTSPSDLATQLRATSSSVLLACEEGSLVWQKSGSTVMVIGDQADLPWWRMLELRAMPYVGNSGLGDRPPESLVA